jgi:spermidine synthase
MIDQSSLRAPTPLRLPVAAGPARILVLAAVFICAACGLVYELELVALASYLVGDSVTQASVVLSVMVFAMGVGSLLAKRLRCAAVAGFVAVEAALALVGGLSVMALYASFAWLGQSRPAMAACAFAIGVLIGAEVPLLMTLIQRIRRQDAGGAVADLFAADYVGALVGGLAFPFLLLPSLGQLSSALFTGAVNVAGGGALVLWLFRGDLTLRARSWLLVANAVVLAVLAGAAVGAAPFERAAQQAIYGGDVRVARHSAVQEIVLTGGAWPSLRLYLDGRLRAGGLDGFRYDEGLVHPAMAGPRRRVLVLGGGDGLAAREVLRYADVRSVTVVDPDAALVRLGRSDPGLAALNHRALRDPRVRVVVGDPFDWVRTLPRYDHYDVILADLPDPGISRSAKFYSEEFYGLAGRALAAGGRLVVHAGSPSVSPRGYWTVDATLRGVGFHTAPYWIGGPREGRGAPRATDWGFLLAARTPPVPRLAADAPPLRSLTPALLRSAARTAAVSRLGGLPPSTLMRPRVSGAE